MMVFSVKLYMLGSVQCQGAISNLFRKFYSYYLLVFIKLYISFIN